MISTIKLALKVLARRKFFTFVSLFGISLTLVVLMVATAILDNVFSPRPPESRFDRVLLVHRLSLSGPNFSWNSNPGFRFIQEYVKDLPGSELTSTYTDPQSAAILQNSVRVPTYLRRTDGAYWRLLDFRFIEGGPFSDADDASANHVVVISEDLRSRLFGRGQAVGRSVSIDGRGFRIVGVVPAVPISRVAAFSEVWMPIGTLPSTDYRHSVQGDFNAAVLARSADDFGSIRAALRERLRHFKFDDPKKFNRVVAGMDTPFEAVAPDVGNDPDGPRALLFRAILFAVALLFISLPTMNLVSINLSRIIERSSEIGVRKSFGASSRALIRQFVLENVVLTLAGGALGFVLTMVALRLIAASDVLPHAVFDLNLRIFGYAMLITVLFGVISGVYPAWRMSRLHPVDALRGGAL